MSEPSTFSPPLPPTDRQPLSERLYVLAGDTPMPLPAWASSLVALGEYLSDLPDEHAPVTVVAELPSRRYAALLVSLGVVAGRQARPVYSLKDFDALAALPHGTRVRYRYQSVAFDGVVEGSVLRDGEPHLVIRRPTGEVHYLPRRLNAQLIGIGDSAHLNTQHRNLQFSGTLLQKEWAFATGVFSEVDAAEYLLADRQDVILFGPAEPLHWEGRLPLAVRNAAGEFLHGELREGVRVKDWRNQGSVNAELFPVSSDTNAEPDLHERFFPSIAVFDGGLAYGNWRYLIDGHHVSLLTPGRAGFQQGDMACKEAFYSSRGIHALPPQVTSGLAPHHLLAFTRST